MAYGATILINGSAEVGTTIGWEVSGGTPIEVSYIPYINDRQGWLSGALDVSLYILGNFPITVVENEIGGTIGWEVSGGTPIEVSYIPYINDRQGWLSGALDVSLYILGNFLRTPVENEIGGTRYIPFPDDRDKWGTWEHLLVLYGPAGDYSFRFSDIEDAEMYQILLASDVGAQPVTFEFIAKFKLSNAQELWDTAVLGIIQFQINYTDATNDYFIIPCVKGAAHADRSLINFWLLVTDICTVDATKTINYVKVVAKTINCVNILNIDYIELRKEV